MKQNARFIFSVIFFRAPRNIDSKPSLGSFTRRVTEKGRQKIEDEIKKQGGTIIAKRTYIDRPSSPGYGIENYRYQVDKHVSKINRILKDMRIILRIDLGNEQENEPLRATG